LLIEIYLALWQDELKYNQIVNVQQMPNCCMRRGSHERQFREIHRWQSRELLQLNGMASLAKLFGNVNWRFFGLFLAIGIQRDQRSVEPHLIGNRPFDGFARGPSSISMNH
jgi:hypothetical protein